MADGDQELAKLVTVSDITNSFEVPPEWWPSVEDQGHLLIIDGLGFFWEFVISKVTEVFDNAADESVNCISRRHFEPFEWKIFATEKGLRPGDRIVLRTLEVQTYTGLRYRFSAQREKSHHWHDL